MPIDLLKEMILEEAVHLGWRFDITHHQGPVLCECGDEAEDYIYIAHDQIMCEDCFLNESGAYRELDSIREEYEAITEQTRQDRREREREYRGISL